jgi:hypothetical protein
MSPSQCPYCERENPPDSKFCNACGAPLYLVPCHSCGAVNEVGARTCHQCAAALPKGNPGAVAAPSTEADPLDTDAKVLATLHDLRRRLATVVAEDAGAPARGIGRGGVDGPAPELAPEIAKAPLSDTPTHYPAPAIAFASRQPARRVGRVRPAGVVIGTAALAAAGVAVLYTFDHRQMAGASKAPPTVGVVKGEANFPTGSGMANPDATNTAAAPVAPAAASLPRVTHGVAKSAAPAPAAATSAVPPEGEARPSGATAAPREPRVTSVTPAAGVGVLPRAVESGAGTERPAPARIGPCTDAMATLGLCNPEPTQRRE